MKPISSSRFPIPSNTRNVYSEIEKKLKDSELKLSETNLRALKQILEGLQALERERRTNCTHTDCMYIAQILLASGILLRDLGSGSTTFQLHSSGLPINPQLFFVLEQTKASSLLSKEDGNSITVSLSNPNHKKIHRKFIFDLVNEILVGKLALLGTSSEPWINSGKLVRKTLNAEKLLKELCMEIEQLQAKKSNSNTKEEGDLKNILLEDVICRPESWFDFNGEISGTVLDVERLVFKDLINETVIGEEGILRSNHQLKHRRCQLFSKNSTVEAKLMGLRPLPDSSSAGGAHLGVVKTGSVEDNNPFSQPLRSNDLNRPTRISNSARSSLNDPTSPRWKNRDMIVKPISSSRFPIEPAPWRHADGNQGSLKQPLKHVKVPSKTPNSSPSVYSEIEKRLKDLEFKQSGKDLRALKQILEAMQAKGLLETEKEERTANLVSQTYSEPKCKSPGPNPRGQQSLQNTRVNTSSTRGSDSIKIYESPIVIMKPAKLVEKCGMHASTDDISSLPKIRSGDSVGNKRGSVTSRAARDHTARNSQSNCTVNSTDKRASSRDVGSLQSSTKPPKESTTDSVKCSGGSRNQRLQQKKLELDRQSRPPTRPSDPSKPRRQSSRILSESSSPGGKRRPKSHNMQQCDDQPSQVSSESWTSSHQGDEISPQSGSNISMESKLEMEVTSHEQFIETNSRQSPSMDAANYSASRIMQKKSTSRLVEDVSVAELAMATPEHPSPVSVLDTLVYRDDAPSPVKQILNIPQGIEAENFDNRHKDDQWNSVDNCLSNNVGSCLVSDISRKKLQKIEHLVQKLRRLNSTHDEASTDYIASLCENTNPDHRYISEILLASGLLLRDLGSGSTTFQLHPSGHPINPELFFVLEQTEASSLLTKEDGNSRTVSLSNPNHKNFHRKLIFDLVNEILVGKLALVGTSSEPWINSGKLVRKTLNAQKLLKELCTEIEQLQAKKSNSNTEQEDGQKNILWEDVMCRSESWADFNDEISGMVLDVERMVFKDLVNEVVIGKGGILRSNQPHRRHQLFSK